MIGSYLGNIYRLYTTIDIQTETEKRGERDREKPNGLDFTGMDQVLMQQHLHNQMGLGNLCPTHGRPFPCPAGNLQWADPNRSAYVHSLLSQYRHPALIRRHHCLQENVVYTYVYMLLRQRLAKPTHVDYKPSFYIHRSRTQS